MKLKEKIIFNKLLFALFIAWLIVMSVFMFCSCTKQEMYVNPPEPYLTIDKTVKYSGQKKVGSQIKFWVDMPTEFENSNGAAPVPPSPPSTVMKSGLMPD